MTIPSGFAPLRFEQYRSETVSLWKGKFGETANTASDTADGLIIDLLTIIRTRYAERLATLYANAYYPSAVGLHLDNILSAFGSKRGQLSGSTVECVVFGSLGTVIQGGSLANSNAGDAFALNANETITPTNYIAITFGPADIVPTTPSAQVAGFDYTAASVSGSGQDVAQALASSPTGLPGDPFPLPGSDARIARWFPPYEDPRGNGVIIIELVSSAPFAAFASTSDAAQWYGQLATFTAEQAGRVSAEARSIVTIGSTTPGWEGVVNLADATPGTDADIDDAYRLRHTRTIGAQGAGTARALGANARKEPGVEHSRVYMNVTGTPDLVSGRPSHSFELVVEGGSTERLGILVWTHHTTGTQSFGSTSVLINDPKNGELRTVYFTRPTKRYVWMDVEIQKGEGFPATPIADLQADVSASMLAWGLTKSMGFDVYPDEARQQIHIPGSAIVTIRLGTTPNPTDPKPAMSVAALMVDERELTRWSADRIAVTVVT